MLLGWNQDLSRLTWWQWSFQENEQSTEDEDDGVNDNEIDKDLQFDHLIIIVDNPREKLGAGAGGRRDTYTAGSYFPLASLAILAHHQL